MLLFILFLLLAVLFGSAGQILLKFSTESNVWALQIAPMLNLYFFLAGFFYLISMILYTLALKGLPLTLAYPSMALSYVFVAWGSHVIWKTPFGFIELLALVLIFCALGLLAYSNSSYLQN